MTKSKKSVFRKWIAASNVQFVEVLKKNNLFFLLAAMILIAIGICWVSSTTQIVLPNSKGDLFQFSGFKIFKQIVALILGLAAMYCISILDFEKTIKKFSIAWIVYGITILLLMITLLMPARDGGRRWIPLYIFNLQTAEFAKIVILFFVASYMGDRRRMADVQQNSFKVFYPFVLAGIGLFFIALEPDIGIPALTFAAICCMMFVSGVSIGNLIRVLLMSIPVFVFDCYRNFGHRLGRIQSYVLSTFSDQKVDVLGDAYQVSKSLIGICSGGITGQGFAHSYQKTHLLSQHDSDFVFSVFAEETGLIGSLLLMSLYGVLIYQCYKIALNTRDSYYRSLAVGFTVILGTQAFYSIAVNANFAPIKGIALPFISYGGSSLISTLIIIGIMMNIAAHQD